MHAFCHIVNQLKNRREMSWAVKVDLLYCVFVCLDNSFDAVALWIENIAVERKAVVCCLIKGRNCSAETKCWYLFIRVIILNNASNTLDCVVILVLFDVADVVKRVWLAWLDV